MSSPPEPGGRTDTYRPFLDGLRALAVLGVLVYHLDRTWLPGGFLGVDLFFVLSGYLITSLVLAEHAATGRIDLPAFWSRRIRRLLPALLVVLVVMAVVIELGGDVLAQGAARGDLLATLFYVANWHFISSGQSYFSQFVAVSPDRHTWSLAIEEQFYILWPLLVAAVLARFPRRTLAVIAAAIAVASALLLAYLFDANDPSRAYYGTDTRIFEILVGALAAMVMGGPLSARAAGISRRLAWPSFFVVLTAFAFLADTNALYYHGAAVGLAVATAVLICGLDSGGGPREVLSLRPLVVVGLVSYGLYLWHFPVITFINQSIGPTSNLPLAGLAVAVSFAATALSFVLVETPIRRRRGPIGLGLTPRRLAWLVPVSSGLVAAVIVVATAAGIPAPGWGLDVVAAGAGTSAAPLQVTITTPAPRLPLPTPDGGPSGTPVVPSAGATAEPLIRTLGVVGDSVIVSALPGLQVEATARGWTLVAAAARGCPIAPQPLYSENGAPSSFNDSCRSLQALHADLVTERPDVIIWEDLQSVLARRAPDGTLLHAGSTAWTSDLVSAWTVELHQLLGAGSQVVIVMPPERSEQAPGCRNVAQEARCLDIQRQDAIIRAATTAFWKSLGGEPRVHLVSVDPLLCPSGMPCPSTIDGIHVRISGYDQTHFTSVGATWFAPRLMDLVVSVVQAGASP